MRRASAGGTRGWTASRRGASSASASGGEGAQPPPSGEASKEGAASGPGPGTGTDTGTGTEAASGFGTRSASGSGRKGESPDELKVRVLDAAVRHVMAEPGAPRGAASVSLGFTKAALQAGCSDVGVGLSAVGLFARPEAMLVEHLSAQLDRATLVEVRRLFAAAAGAEGESSRKEKARGSGGHATEASGGEGEGAGSGAGAEATSEGEAHETPSGEQVSDAWRGGPHGGKVGGSGGLLPHTLEGRMSEMIQHRLRLLVPYLPVWGGALAAKVADPRSVAVAAGDAGKFIDDLLYEVGDRTGEMGWYSKRALWLSVYKATELHLLMDVSVDYADTWDFLGRRVKDARSVETNLGALALVSRVAAKEGDKFLRRLGNLRYPQQAPPSGHEDETSNRTKPI